MFQRSLLAPIQRGSRSRSRSAPPSNFQEIGGKLLDTGLRIAWFTSNSSHLGHKPVAKHVAIIQSFSDHLRSSQYTLNLIWICHLLIPFYIQRSHLPHGLGWDFSQQPRVPGHQSALFWCARLLSCWCGRDACGDAVSNYGWYMYIYIYHIIYIIIYIYM